MAFTRWDPLRDLLALQERMERLSGQEATGWTPPVDIFETADAFVVTAELPGLNRDDIDIRYHDGQLSLQVSFDAFGVHRRRGQREPP